MASPAEAATELVARCFAARTAAHFAHLITRSYARHVALGEFYDGIVDKADAFIECFQGVYGPVKAFPDVKATPGEVTPIKELRDWLQKNRAAASGGQSELANLIDEATAVCDRALYKLVNLG